MGIFSKKKDGDVRENQIIKELEESHFEGSKKLAVHLMEVMGNPEKSSIRPIYVYFDVVEMIKSNPQFDQNEYHNLVLRAEKLYRDIFIYEEETPNFDELEKVFIELFDQNSAVYRNCFNATFFNLFENKHNYVKWLRSLPVDCNINASTDYYVAYAVVARSYFMDEDMFTANMIRVTKRLLDTVNYQEVCDEEAKKLEHMVGLYNVDEARIMSFEQRMDSVEMLLKQSSSTLKLLEERMESIDQVSKQSIDSVNHMCENQITVAKAELNQIHEKMNRAYNDFCKEQKTLAVYDRQQFVESMFSEAEQKLSDIKNHVNRTISSADMELSRISKKSGDAVSRFDSYIKNEDNLQKIIAVSSAIPEPQNEVPATGNGVTTIVQVASEDEVVLPVNPLLDENIDFNERYKRVMQKKREMEASGVHFHAMFDDVVIAVMENSNPYLIGPSGCGKTYMVAQIAQVLEMDFIDIGYINEEYDILGFQTANGGYSRPNFYRCYKYGKIAFCDELDNGNSRATVKLNSFLSNTEDASYNFPNGEQVKRHSNFRIIGAGNTAGNGADSNYNTREKIEESVQQRFTPIFVDYDNDVEKAILKNYPKWFEFVKLFREATDAWADGNYGDAPGIITTRDVTRIKKYLDNKSFTDKQIINYEFVQTKSKDYLAFLEEYMKEHVNSKVNIDDLIQAFSNLAETDYRKRSLQAAKAK